VTEFHRFPKIPRLRRDVIITEKLDGTNTQVFVHGEVVLAGSKNRWITPGDDHYGFAAWVRDHHDELLGLGDGHHYGEWWGGKCQRGYGLAKMDMRWSLFNVLRWQEKSPPSCCSIVPVLYRGPFSESAIDGCLSSLRESGSVAVPGFMNPEGIIVYHVAGGHLYKVTLERDEEPKGMASRD
jgi:hypothetical protein